MLQLWLQLDLQVELISYPFIAFQFPFVTRKVKGQNLYSFQENQTSLLLPMILNPKIYTFLS